MTFTRQSDPKEWSIHPSITTPSLLPRFLRHWRTEPLLAPSYYTNRQLSARTRWTPAGLALSSSDDYKKGKIAAKPGLHFVAVTPTDQSYFLFPEEPHDVYRLFRHAWALVRKRIPDVVVIEGLKQPSTARTAVYNAQYCSLFFRPCYPSKQPPARNVDPEHHS